MPETKKLLRSGIVVFVHVLLWVTIAYVFSQVFRTVFKKLHLVNGRITETIEVRTFLAFVIISLAFKAIFFYLNALYRPSFLLSRQKPLQHGLFFGVAMTTLAGIELLIILAAGKLWQMERPPAGLAMWPEIFMWVIAFVVSITWYKMRELDRAEQLSKKIAEEHLKSELNFLKAQISPHFFLNTLNNLYSMAQAKGIDDLEDGILQLAQLMRYMLYDCQADVVSVEREVECIRSYVGLALQRYRQDGNIVVTFDSDESSLAGLMIAPAILVPFIENAFKHGIAPGKPSFIDIKLFAENSQLIFKVENIDHSNQFLHFENNGIGINNVKRRLDMIYPGKHLLRTSKESSVYTIILKLTANEVRNC